jgi:hypothetical protein
MSRRLQPAVWMLCALLLLAQSVLPASAMALVSMRCVGMPVTAHACAEAVLPVAETTHAETYLAPMSCCRHMHSDCPLMGVGQAETALHPAVLSALPCRVSVTPLNNEQPVAITGMRQWMLTASPAMAPPRIMPVVPVLGASTRIRSTLSYSIPPDRFTRSHGLRAPPVA